MLLPPEYAWIGLVIMGTVFVFIADLIGNTLHFSGSLRRRKALRCLTGAAGSFPVEHFEKAIG